MYKWTSKFPDNQKDATNKNDDTDVETSEKHTGKASETVGAAVSDVRLEQNISSLNVLEVQRQQPESECSFNPSDSAKESGVLPQADVLNVEVSSSPISSSSGFRNLQSKFENYSSCKDVDVKTPLSNKKNIVQKKVTGPFRNSEVLSSFRRTMFCPTVPSKKIGSLSKPLKCASTSNLKTCESSQIKSYGTIASNDGKSESSNSNPIVKNLYAPEINNDIVESSNLSDDIKRKLTSIIEHKISNDKYKSFASCKDAHVSSNSKMNPIYSSFENPDSCTVESKNNGHKNVSGDTKTVFSPSHNPRLSDSFGSRQEFGRSSSLPRIFSKLRLFRNKNDEEDMDQESKTNSGFSLRSPGRSRFSLSAHNISLPFKVAEKTNEAMLPDKPKKNLQNAENSNLKRKNKYADVCSGSNKHPLPQHEFYDNNTVSQNEITTTRTTGNFKNANNSNVFMQRRKGKSSDAGSSVVDPKFCSYGSLQRSLPKKKTNVHESKDKNPESSENKSFIYETSPDYYPQSSRNIISKIPRVLSLPEHQPLPNSLRTTTEIQEKGQGTETNIANFNSEPQRNFSPFKKNEYRVNQTRNNETFSDNECVKSAAVFESHRAALFDDNCLFTSNSPTDVVHSSTSDTPEKVLEPQVEKSFKVPTVKDFRPCDSLIPEKCRVQLEDMKFSTNTTTGDKKSIQPSESAYADNDPLYDQPDIPLVERLMRQNNVMELHCVLKEAEKLLELLKSDMSNIYTEIYSLCLLPAVKFFVKCRLSAQDIATDQSTDDCESSVEYQDSCAPQVSQEIHKLQTNLQCHCLEFRDSINQLTDKMISACRDWSEEQVPVLLRVVQKLDVLRMRFKSFRKLCRNPLQTSTSAGKPINEWCSRCPQALLLKLFIEQNETLMVKLQYGLAMCRMYAKLTQLAKECRFTVQTLEYELNFLKGIPVDVELSEL